MHISYLLNLAISDLCIYVLYSSCRELQDAHLIYLFIYEAEITRPQSP